MAPKMVANFRRSLSFPNHPSCSSSKPKKAYHVRSASLPCSRSNPLISQLKDEINELKSWASSSEKENARTSAWLLDGLSQLKIVQESLDDLLQHPRTRESLIMRDHASHQNEFPIVEKFLDAFLRLVDIYGIFQTLILTLKEHHLAAEVAVRKRDDSKMSLHLKSFRKLAKEFSQLASSLKSIGKFTKHYCSSPKPGIIAIAEEEEDAEEIVRVIEDVIEVTALVSFALFNGLSLAVSLLGSRKVKPSCFKFSFSKTKINIQQEEEGIGELEGMSNSIRLESLRKKDGEELRWTSERMHELEDCIGGIEIGGERVFRSLINTRVSLLNVHTML